MEVDAKLFKPWLDMGGDSPWGNHWKVDVMIDIEKMGKNWGI